MFRKTINSADYVKSDINFMHSVIKVSHLISFTLHIS